MILGESDEAKTKSENKSYSRQRDQTISISCQSRPDIANVGHLFPDKMPPFNKEVRGNVICKQLALAVVKMTLKDISRAPQPYLLCVSYFSKGNRCTGFLHLWLSLPILSCVGSSLCSLVIAQMCSTLYSCT